MNALISVIIPIYNVEKYLDRCVESVIMQSYQNLEIILVDDGSGDNCPRMCDMWAIRDTRIKVIHKENAGVGMARNSGLEAATGDYLMFVDSDDYISLDAIQVLYERLIADKSDMAVGRHTDVYDDGQTNGTYCRWMRNDRLSAREALVQMGEEHHIAVSAWGKLYRRTVFEKIRFSKISYGEDLWVFPLILLQCHRISTVDSLVYYYYQRSNSLIHERTEKSRIDELDATLHMVYQLLQNDIQKGSEKWFRRAIDRAVWCRDKKEALQLFERYLDRPANKELLRRQSIKTRIKWLSLKIPFISFMVQSRKRCIRR